MRCISPHARYSIQIIEGDEQIVVDARGHATTVVQRKPVVADFRQGGLLDNELEVALESFNFSGIPDGVNPLTRISSFDTEAYTTRFPEADRPRLLEEINDRLRELQERFPSEFVVVDEPAAPKPWPSYDENTPEEIIEWREKLDIDPELVRRYEQENLGRKAVVDAMANPGQVEDIIVSA